MYRFDEGNCSKEVAITDDGRRATCLPSLVYPSFRLRDPFFTAVRCVQLRVEALPDLGFISFGFGPSNFHKNEDCIPEDVANYFAYAPVLPTVLFCNIWPATRRWGRRTPCAPSSARTASESAAATPCSWS